MQVPFVNKLIGRVWQGSAAIEHCKNVLLKKIKNLIYKVALEPIENSAGI